MQLSVYISRQFFLSAFIITATLSYAIPLPARAEKAAKGPYEARLVRVIDGDTLDVIVQTWPGHFIETAVRIKGIDTPELKGKCAHERKLAQQAKNHLLQIIAGNMVTARSSPQQPQSPDPPLSYNASAQAEPAVMTLHDVELGKYAGRVLARVKINSQDVAAQLIAVSLARPYHGGKRFSWCFSNNGLASKNAASLAKTRPGHSLQ